MSEIKRIIAIDPGTVQSAWVLFDKPSWRVIFAATEANEAVLKLLKAPIRYGGAEFAMIDHVAIEMVQAMGMAVGREVFETVYWIGRFCEARQASHEEPQFTRITRGQVKQNLCRSAKAKDPNIRQAVMDRFGATKVEQIGNKKEPGPLYGVHGDEWSALAVAVTYFDMLNEESRLANTTT